MSTYSLNYKCELCGITIRAMRKQIMNRYCTMKPGKKPAPSTQQSYQTLMQMYLGEQYQNFLTATILEMKEIMEMVDEILEVHGVAPGRKAEGVMRVIYENSDGLNNRIERNRKFGKGEGDNR